MELALEEQGQRATRFRIRVMGQFHQSHYYKYKLRGEETRNRSNRVLSALIDRALGNSPKVRRCDLCEVFVYEGASRRDKKPGMFKDRQLQIILEGLVEAGVIDCERPISPSKRIKDKTKRDSYYFVKGCPCGGSGVWTIGWRTRPDSILSNPFLFVNMDMERLEEAGIIDKAMRAWLFAFLLLSYSEWTGGNKEWEEIPELTPEEYEAVERFALRLPEELSDLGARILKRVDQERAGLE